MGEILAIGVTHYPPLAWRDEMMTIVMKRMLQNPQLPERYRHVENWPAPMREEWGADEGTTTARHHRELLRPWFHKVRTAIDDFAPDFVLVWGDDQYENFKEDIVPAFCVAGYDDEIALQPWHNGANGSNGGGKPNRWSEKDDWNLNLKGHREAAKYLTTGLIEAGIDMAYAYKPLHHPMAHAFTNTFLYLDWDRKGFPYPVIPFAVNCYGRNLIYAKGGLGHLFAPPRPAEEGEDPSSPHPWRCMEVGAKVAEVLARSPYRVALVASSSWSHAFLSPKNGYLWPDHEGDRLLFDAVSRADYATWRKRSLDEMEFAGQHEMLNWMCLIGAMEALDRKPVIQDYMETYILASDKCFLSFPA
jgi:hypothetical protein